MSNYTNFAFIDGDSIVVLERCGHPGAPVFGPAADAIRDSGAANDDEDVFVLGLLVAWIFGALGSISLVAFGIMAVMQALN